MSKITTMGELVPGDVIRAPDGSEVIVSRAYDEHVPERMFEITTDTGDVVRASGNHLWYVETDVDIQSHHARRIAGRQALAGVASDAARTQQLLRIADHDVHALDDDNADIFVSEDDKVAQISLAGIIDMLDVRDSMSAVNALSRIAVSLGPVAEVSIIYTDAVTGKEIPSGQVVRMYDAVRFAQQVLSLIGKREWRRQWALIVGRVVQTTELAQMAQSVELPTVHPAAQIVRH